LNKYEITIRTVDKKRKRIVVVESEFGIDWMAKAVKEVGE
jgi:hypothetical protein